MKFQTSFVVYCTLNLFWESNASVLSIQLSCISSTVKENGGNEILAQTKM